MSDDHQEIVIIKRHHGDHDDHHGGIWKIAFADFMTAMMAFFLVMWLIAANDKTRATVARYFNPVKLVDATVRKQGLHDPKVDDATAASPHDAKDGRSTEKDKQPGNPPPDETPKEREARLDATMRSNPLAALAEIAEPRKAGEGPPTDALNGAAPVIGHAGGTAFRDPFAPPPTQAADVDDKDVDPMDVLPPKSAPRSINPATRRAEKPSPDQKPDDQTEEKGDVPKPPSPKADAAKAQREDADLAKLVASLKTPGREADGPDVKVRRTGEGYLVSLTDTEAFSMFANGSAVPSRRVVQMMERIAKALAAKKGGVIVRGFTDNKPFRSGRYDNWNLSVDRAQAAHYMLVRGGLSDARIAGVQGFADHGASPGVDPASPLNRRIEILLKDEPT